MTNEMFEKLKPFGHMQIREDLKYMQEMGVWKGGTVPAWVKLIADAHHCLNASTVIFSTAWEFVAESVIAENEVAQEPSKLPKPNKEELKLLHSDVPGAKLQAIKLFRQRTGCALKDAQAHLSSAAKGSAS